jgi:hypothetical protein
MNARTWVSITAALLVTSVGHATLEFSAYARIGRESEFVVTDLEAGKSSAWIALGQTFSGYTLVAFDEKKQVLSVRKDNAITELVLKPASVKEGRKDSPELVAAREELARLRVRYLDKHPLVRAQLEKIAGLEAQASK